MWKQACAGAVLAVAFILGGCETMPKEHEHASMWANVNHAVAVVYPTRGNTISGTIKFDQMPEGVHVSGQISGLAPNSSHGFHIHEFGDQSSEDGTSAGSHYNPEGHAHAGPMTMARHAGDMGNITADGSGVAKIDLMLNNISVAGMKNPVIGRGIVVHANPDDFTTPNTGNAGARIGVGVIGIAK